MSRIDSRLTKMFARDRSPQRAASRRGSPAVRRRVLPSCLHGHSAPSGASCRQSGGPFTSGDAHNVLEGLSGVSERPMIIPMMTTVRSQQRYDHRLRELVQRTGDLTIATDLGVPRSTARGWLDKAPKVVVSLDETDLRAPELQPEILKLRRRVKSSLRYFVSRWPCFEAPSSRSHARASAQRSRQDSDSCEPRHLGPKVCSVAGDPTVPPIVAKSVPWLAPAAVARVR